MILSVYAADEQGLSHILLSVFSTLKSILHEKHFSYPCATLEQPLGNHKAYGAAKAGCMCFATKKRSAMQ